MAYCLHILLRVFYLALFLCFWSLEASGQQIDIRNVSVRQGMTNNFVKSITQDKRGFLWFATEEGLNCLEGGNVRTFYKTADSIGLTGNELNCLLDDPCDSVLWIATQRNGLNAYDYKKKTFRSYTYNELKPNGIKSDAVTHLAPASDGGIWISTYWAGVDHLDTRTGYFTHYSKENVAGLPDDQLWTVVEAPDNKLFVGHVRHGLSIVSIGEHRAVNFRHDPTDPYSLPHDEVNTICVDRDRRIWVGTAMGMAFYDAHRARFIRMNDGHGNLQHSILDIRQMDDGRLWVATEFDGVVIVDLPLAFMPETEKLNVTLLHKGKEGYNLSSSRIRCLFQDSFGNRWIGTYGKGVDFISNTSPLFDRVYQATTFSVGKEAKKQGAMTVCIDSCKRLWTGMDEGRINCLSCNSEPKNYDLETNIVQASLCDAQGRMWFGLFYDGLVCIPPGGTPVKVCTEELGGSDVRSIIQVRSGDILVGTSRGTYVLDPIKMSVKAHYEYWNNLTRCLLEDSRGQFWVGTYGGGLQCFDASWQHIVNWHQGNGLPSNTVNALYEDTQGRLWVATGDGLGCFPTVESREFTSFGREKGLQNSFICAINEDEAGRIWISNNKGIACLIENEQGHWEVRNYDFRDNLPLEGFYPNSTVKDADGSIYFGSSVGLYKFSPAVVMRPQFAPSPIILGLDILEDINYSGKQVCEYDMPAKGQHICLKAKQNNFKVRFTTSNFALAEHLEYAYCLAGNSDIWLPVIDKEFTIFKNLPPGKYQFQLKSRIRGQAWPEEYVSLDLHIRPPLWQQWWMIILYVCLFILVGLYSLYIYNKRMKRKTQDKLALQRLEQEQALNQERLRFYTNITHELRTPLTLIIGPLEDLLGSRTMTKKDTHKISLIHQSALRLLDLINQLLEFRKVETQNRKLCVTNSDIVQTVKEIGLKYKELKSRSNVEFCLDISEETIVIYYDVEAITFIMDNLISNALKYTTEGAVTIGVRRIRRGDRDLVNLWVSDTGCGIKAEHLDRIFDRYYQEHASHQASGTGIGLSLVKNLVHIHEGEISVESVLGEGSTFCVYLQADNTYPHALHNDTSISALPQSIESEQTECSDNDSSTLPVLLVVEDNTDICNYVADSLSDRFKILKASNGKEGLELARCHIPDIIVSDVMMPVMDGIMLCRELKKDICTSHIPIIILTAKTSMHDKEEGYQTGADSYLTKPFSIGLLISRINNLLQSRRQLAGYYLSQQSQATMNNIQEPLPVLNKLDEEFIRKLNALIKEHMDSEEFNISYLAECLCMSFTTLYRKVKALTGLSTNEYIRKFKMRHAECLLREGHTVSETAFMVGISSLRYFRKCFVDEFGHLPTEYLRLLREHSSDTTSNDV